jgi:hypothetical protein
MSSKAYWYNCCYMAKQFTQVTGRTLELVPVALPAALAAFGVVAVSLLLLNGFHTILVGLLGLGAAYAAVRVVSRHYKNIDRPGSRQEQKRWDLVVLIGVVLWILVNLAFASQNVFVNRDPAVYGVSGAWLVQHDDLRLPLVDAFGKVEGLDPVGLGFGYSVSTPGELFAQGLHLLPAFIGLTGRFLGQNAMLRINPVFGGCALLAVYGFARLVARPRWAGLVTGALALTFPMIYFSRNTFTEPLAMIFTFGALSLIWAAQRTASRPLLLMAGVVAGGGSLTRIDAPLVFIALAAFFAAFLALAPRQARKERAIQAGLFAVGALGVSLIGWLDVVHLSSGYYQAQSKEFGQQLMALGGVILLGLVAVAVFWRFRLTRVLDKKTKTWRPAVALILVLLMAVGLASRPFWYVSHGDADNALVRSMQFGQGKVVDGTRDYAEQSATWVGWYMGPALAALGVGGLALASAQAVRRKDLLLVPGVLVVAGTSLVFLTQPSITPDQIWATRRLLPVIMPGLAVFAAFGLDYLWTARLPFVRGAFKKPVWSLGVVAIFAPLLFISYPAFGAQTYASELRQIRRVCETLPENAAVVWVGIMRENALQTTRTFCDVPSMGARSFGQTALATAAATARSRGYEPVIAITPETQVQTPAFARATVVSVENYALMPSTLYAPPRRTELETRIILIGSIETDGSIGPLPALNL